MSGIGAADYGVACPSSFDDFQSACLSYLETCAAKSHARQPLGSHQYSGGWKWQDPHQTPVVLQMSAGLIRTLNISAPALAASDLHQDDWDEGMTHDANLEIAIKLVASSSAQHISRSDVTVSVHQSIHWSNTWRVPVLYFHASWPSGQPLSLDELTATRIIHHSGTLRSALLQESASAEGNKVNGEANENDSCYFAPISYGDHPRTGFPSFYLHPCQTAQFLSDLLPPSAPAGLYMQAFVSLCASAIEMRA